MKVSAPLDGGGHSLGQTIPKRSSAPKTDGGKIPFETILQGVKGDPHAELIQLRDGLLKGKAFSPQELLRYQVAASSFGLRVELVSKVADGLLTTVKRLQNQ